MLQENKQQELPLFENVWDALRDLVRHLGGTKIVGQLLRPQKTVAEAQAWLSNCLDPARPEKLDAQDLIFLLRKACEADYHAVKHYIDDEAGYRFSQPRDPKDELAELQRQYIQSVALQKSIAERMERLSRLQLQPAA